MSETSAIVLRTAHPIQLERCRLEDNPDLAPDAAVVGTFVDGRLIARCAAVPDWTQEHDHNLFDTPRQVCYVGHEIDGGVIHAKLTAIIPAADLPRKPWEQAPDGEALVLLGIVVRLAHERSQQDLEHECVHHFASLLHVGAEPVIDRQLRAV